MGEEFLNFWRLGMVVKPVIPTTWEAEIIRRTVV
jgi:hypothetical protein